jgi:hypothetical protein
MKAYGGVDVLIHVFLTSALVGGEWSALRPGRFTPGKELPGTHIGGWIGPRKEKNRVPLRTRTPTPQPSSPWPVAILSTLFRFPFR